MGLPQEVERGSIAPFERTDAADGSGIAGGKGNTCEPELTWTTRSTAWRYEDTVL